MWILTVAPLPSVALPLTNPPHHEFITGYDGVHPIPGSLFIVNAFISYIPILISVFILVRYVTKNIAKNSDSAEKINECMDKINTASKHLLGVINDILDMSKIESNQ